ncbi:AraC family transcriptional regulator [Natranaerovirga pectinivora]|uniref:AraC family transcriptional regulator n=1 Tax=Natranaerovirga pectinivora TaxID=682400 RepID=A0A4R3MNZ3_9FIRM|nr:AraC family transcriptional regulator [Natranaerovirga pectinivora]TCT16997.1 AraC family transcriptional regulator [Natranaerovirga pectinivora]
MVSDKVELITVKKNNPNYILPVWFGEIDDNNDIITSKDRFLLVFVNKGTGIIKIGDQKRIFTSPCVFCLNEKETIELEKSKDFNSKVFYFHPSFINSIFTLENIKGQKEGLTMSDIRDLHWLDSFIKRKENYIGIYTMGPATTKHIESILNNIKNQMEIQSDGYWPCRTRSYFLELLFILERLYNSIDTMEEVVLDNIPDDINKIILYLHNNYQKKITIKDLSNTFHMNRTTLNNRFSEATGSTVMTYLIKLRVKLAALMLKDTMISISEIIERIGISDTSHFGRIFKKHMGCSPTEYRKLNSRFY